jgi:hypothetical protein
MGKHRSWLVLAFTALTASQARATTVPVVRLYRARGLGGGEIRGAEIGRAAIPGRARKGVFPATITWSKRPGLNGPPGTTEPLYAIQTGGRGKSPFAAPLHTAHVKTNALFAIAGDHARVGVNMPDREFFEQQGLAPGTFDLHNMFMRFGDSVLVDRLDRKPSDKTGVAYGAERRRGRYSTGWEVWRATQPGTYDLVVADGPFSEHKGQYRRVRLIVD